jgi:hypothetical protein
MATKEELTARKTALETAIKNVLEGGQEFQTRNARVKQVPLEILEEQLAEVESALDTYNGTNATTVLLKYGGCR